MLLQCLTCSNFAQITEDVLLQTICHPLPRTPGMCVMVLNRLKGHPMCQFVRTIIVGELDAFHSVGCWTNIVGDQYSKQTQFLVLVGPLVGIFNREHIY